MQDAGLEHGQRQGHEQGKGTCGSTQDGAAAHRSSIDGIADGTTDDTTDGIADGTTDDTTTVGTILHEGQGQGQDEDVRDGPRRHVHKRTLHERAGDADGDDGAAASSSAGPSAAAAPTAAVLQRPLQRRTHMASRTLRRTVSEWHG